MELTREQECITWGHHIYLDFLGPVKRKIFIVITDAYSKWLFASEMSSITLFPRNGRVFKYYACKNTFLLLLQTEQRKMQCELLKTFNTNGTHHQS